MQELAWRWLVTNFNLIFVPTVLKALMCNLSLRHLTAKHPLKPQKTISKSKHPSSPPDPESVLHTLICLYIYIRCEGAAVWQVVQPNMTACAGSQTSGRLLLRIVFPKHTVMVSVCLSVNQTFLESAKSQVLAPSFLILQDSDHTSSK